MKPIKIAITGKMRAGKSSASDLLILHHGFERVSFGAGIKRLADDLFDDHSKYYEAGPPCPFDGSVRKIKRKPRRLYQQIGESLRAIDPLVWIRQAARMVDYYEDKKRTRGIVIDDLRQPDEYEWAKANGFIIIRVNAKEDTRIERAKAAGDAFSLDDMRHSTEQYVDDFVVDYEIWNDDDVSRDELERKIDEIVDEIKTKGGR